MAVGSGVFPDIGAHNGREWYNNRNMYCQHYVAFNLNEDELQQLRSLATDVFSGFNNLGLRLSHKASDRETTVNAFNGRTNPVQVLSTNANIPNTAYNMQEDYCDIILADTTVHAQGGGLAIKLRN
ncbi:MAG: hypothetical protein Q9217_000691 [Psora testacea]